MNHPVFFHLFPDLILLVVDFDPALSFKFCYEKNKTITQMTWYIKEFSKLTNVSVRALHHYDHIGLLKPSIRHKNGYRVYSQDDLLKQQQINALKSFGFTLKQIKAFFAKGLSLETHLYTQLKFLREKASALQNIIHVLEKILLLHADNKSITWENIIKLIEVYQMTQASEKTWVNEVLNKDERKLYAEFQQHLSQKGKASEAAFKKRWQGICKEIKAHLKDDPSGEIAIKLAEKVHGAIYDLYGKKYAGLKHTIWTKGFKTGANQKEDNKGLTPQMIEWLDSAMDAYWQNRYRNILKRIGQKLDKDIIEAFCLALDEMYGSETTLKLDFLNIIKENAQTPESTKKWLDQHIIPTLKQH